MKRNATFWIVVTLLAIVSIDFVGYLLIAPMFERFISRPSSDYLSRAESVIERHFPDSADSVMLMRVDRVTAATYFTFEIPQETVEALLHASPDADFTIDFAPIHAPTKITIFTGTRHDSRDYLYLVKLSDELWYGGHRYTTDDGRFMRRFKEYRPYFNE